MSNGETIISFVTSARHWAMGVFRLPAAGIVYFAAVVASTQFGSGAEAEIADHFPGAEWESVDATASGWSVDKLKDAETWSQDIGTTALMVVHHGSIVGQWGDVAAKTPLASVRKSFLSALYGNAVARGEIDLKQNLAQLGIDDNEPSLSVEEKTATVRDLLEARSGVYHAALYETPSMAMRRPPRHSHPPGTFWYYNNWDFNTLGAIYEHAARHSIFDALETEISEPIGMQDYQTSDGQYVTGAASVYPAYPINMSARDLARFGLLYLHKGKWRDRRVVPSSWVEESTRSYSEAVYASGYGFLWWIGMPRNPLSASTTATEPSGCFFALGYGGQLAFVSPAYDLVVVRRGLAGAPGQLDRLLRMLFDAGHLGS